MTLLQMKHTVLEQSSFQNYTPLAFVQTDVRRQVSSCDKSSSKGFVVEGTDWVLLLANGSILLSRQARQGTERCQSRAHIQQHTVRRHPTPSSAARRRYCLRCSDHLLPRRFFSLGFSAWFPKTRSLRKDALRARHESFIKFPTQSRVTALSL